MFIDEGKQIPDDEEKSESYCCSLHSCELVSERILLDMLILDFDNRYFLLNLLFFLLRLHLSVGSDLWREEHGCSFGEEQKIRILHLDEVKSHEEGDEK